LLRELDVLAEGRSGAIKLNERVAAGARDEHDVARSAVLSAVDMFRRFGCRGSQWARRRSALD
jgi:hypothetical protein